MLLNSEIVKDFSDEEKELVKSAYTDLTANVNQSKIVTDIYVARMYRESTQMLIEANKEMSKASERYAKSLTWATWGLVVATVALVIVTLLQFLR